MIVETMGKSKLKSYVAGSIHGLEKEQSYRTVIGNFLTDLGIDCYDPWEHENLEYDRLTSHWKTKKSVFKRLSTKVINRDLDAIDECDILIAYVPKYSAGTSMELFYMNRIWKKPTFVIWVGDGSFPSPWIYGHSTYIYRTMEEFKKKFKRDLDNTIKKWWKG